MGKKIVIVLILWSIYNILPVILLLPLIASECILFRKKLNNYIVAIIYSMNYNQHHQEA